MNTKELLIYVQTKFPLPKFMVKINYISNNKNVKNRVLWIISKFLAQHAESAILAHAWQPKRAKT